MRVNKRAVLWTAGISIISVAVCLLCYLYHKCQLIYDLALACFGSAVLALIVAIISYKTEKRESMEVFYEKAQDAIDCVKRIKHLEFDAPDGLVRAALHEEAVNMMDAPLYEKAYDLMKEYIGQDRNKAKNELMDWFEQKLALPNDNLSGEEESRILENEYKDTLKRAEDALKRTVQGYMGFIEMDLRPFGTAYARMDYILRNKKMKDLTYKQLYGRIQSFQNQCRNEKMVFSSYLERKQAVWVCIDKVKELDCKLYREDKGTLYAFAVDELNDALDTFWEKIYGEELIRDEHTPVRVMISFEDTQQLQKNEERRRKETITGRNEKAEVDAKTD